MRQAISPRLAIRIFLNIRDAPQRPWSNRAVLFHGHRAGSTTGSGVGKAQSTVEHCTVPGRFCNKSAAHNLLYSSDSTSGFLYPRTARRGINVGVSRAFVPTVAFKFGEIYCDVGGHHRYGSVQGFIARFQLRNPSTGSGPRSGITAPHLDHYPRPCPLFCKASARQRTIRSSQGIGQYRRACRSDNREHAPSDEIRAVSVRAPNADRFRRPRRAGFSASPVAKR